MFRALESANMPLIQKYKFTFCARKAQRWNAGGAILLIVQLLLVQKDLFIRGKNAPGRRMTLFPGDHRTSFNKNWYENSCSRLLSPKFAIPVTRMLYMPRIVPSPTDTLSGDRRRDGLPPSLPPPLTGSLWLLWYPSLLSDLSCEQFWPILLLIKKSVKSSLGLVQFRRWPWPARDNFLPYFQLSILFSINISCQKL